ncbi:lipopolysaccharide transport periplasmic protein LptA [Variovorax sp. HJSM1_2]|uniref:lipopolysaccharide transport periplasmic protein LptA n=1 Tax=Variovorax sp. HJSM1_2 TaxID=3366263 RepID=UPI003BCB61EB
MKKINTIALLLAALAFTAGAAHAETADRDKPMNVEADAMRYDDLKQTNVFTGNVVMTKGTIILRGARVDVRQDPEGYQYGVVTAAAGKLAFFRQKREGVDEFIEGEAEEIYYDSKADNVRLVRRAVMRRYLGTKLSDETTGAEINYHNTTGVFTVDGSVRNLAGAPGGAGTANSGGRVRAMLTPKSAASAPAVPDANTTAPALRPSLQLGGERK